MVCNVKDRNVGWDIFKAFDVHRGAAKFQNDFKTPHSDVLRHSDFFLWIDEANEVDQPKEWPAKETKKC